MYHVFLFFFFFFFNDTATTEIYTLSLHDALPTCAEPPRDEHTDSSQGAGAARNELHALQHVGCPRLGGDLEHTVGSEAAEQHPYEPEADPRDVRSRNDRSLGRTLQPAGREGEEDVQEQNRR